MKTGEIIHFSDHSTRRFRMNRFESCRSRTVAYDVCVMYMSAGLRCCFSACHRRSSITTTPIMTIENLETDYLTFMHKVM